MSTPRGRASEIEWSSWSREAFEKAKKEGKLILLDLSAGWCHWCHVMDETTYSDKHVIDTINSKFIPVRVDIDERPDISERYNRGGFPTTAFLSDKGESVWGGTYVPPQDMKRIMEAVLSAHQSGEIEQALERSRMQYLDLSKSMQQRPPLDSAIVDTAFEDIFASYDVQNGGFGTEPKFPHPEAVDLLIQRYNETKDPELADAIDRTLSSMTEGLYDPVEGGIFRYSVTKDWRTPHYEKMLEGNAGFLRNLVRARVALGRSKFAKTANGVATYMIDTLQDQESGGFFGSQDADEDYYKLSCPQRRNVSRPEIMRTIYAGWNSEASSSLIEAGALLNDPALVDAGARAFRYTLDRLWDSRTGLVRHALGRELFLFEDQVSFLESLVAMLEMMRSDELTGVGNKLIDAVERTFKDQEGGYSDISKDEGAVGEMGTGRRSLVSNSKWARALALYGAATHRTELAERGRAILNAFTQRDIYAHGLFAASYISAWWALEQGTMTVEIRGSSGMAPLDEPLWTAVKESMNPSAVVLLKEDEEGVRPDSRLPFAVVCKAQDCSKPVTDPDELKALLQGQKPSQF